MQIGISSWRKAGAVIKTNYLLLSTQRMLAGFTCIILLILYGNLGGRFYDDLHFTDKEIKALPGKVTCLRSLSCPGAWPVFGGKVFLFLVYITGYYLFCIKRCNHRIIFVTLLAAGAALEATVDGL